MENIYGRFSRDYGGIDLQEIESNADNPPIKIRNWLSTTLLPSASANNPGAKQTMLPSADANKFLLLQVATVTFAGTFALETATAVFTITFSDDSTQVFTIGATAIGSPGVSMVDIAGLMKDNTYIQHISVGIQSNISNSEVTATARMIALQV